MSDEIIAAFAEAERQRREQEGREGRTKLLRHGIRVAGNGCEHFDLGSGAHWEDDVGAQLEPALRSQLHAERCHELDPIAKRPEWLVANGLYSTEWVSQWVRLVDALKALDAHEPGIVALALGMKPTEERYRVMHTLFSSLLTGTLPEDVAATLARVRAQMVPTKEEFVRQGFVPAARFSLGHYFNLLVSSFGPVWESPRARSAPPRAMHTSEAEQGDKSAPAEAGEPVEECEPSWRAVPAGGELLTNWRAILRSVNAGYSRGKKDWIAEENERTGGPIVRIGKRVQVFENQLKSWWFKIEERAIAASQQEQAKDHLARDHPNELHAQGMRLKGRKNVPTPKSGA